jgi:molecular chaperone DnaK (HSP70)
VHENTAAATMYGIDKKLETNQNVVVLFYNMGAMDTEVSIVRYSLYNITDKKNAPYIEVLSETYVKELGTNDMQLGIVSILADKFN